MTGSMVFDVLSFQPADADAGGDNKNE